MTIVIKVLAIKVIMYILNWDIVEKRPRSGVKFINHNKKASETWVKLHWNVKAMA